MMRTRKDLPQGAPSGWLPVPVGSIGLGTSPVLVSVLATVLLLLPGYVRAAQCTGSTATPPGSSAGLVADCEALLAAKDALPRNVWLNWSTDLAIAQWEGVRVRGGRLESLDLGVGQLTRLDIRVHEPLVAYSAPVRIEHGRLFIKGGQITPPRGDLNRALRAYGVQLAY